MEKIVEHAVKILDNPHGFPMIKEVPDAYGQMLLPLNDVYRCLYVKGQIPPGFCKYSSNNYFRTSRWPHYPIQEALDTRDYDWKGLLKSLHRLHIDNEKEAFCLGYMSGYGYRKNPLYMKLMELAACMDEKNLHDAESCRKAKDWLFKQAHTLFSEHLSYLPEVHKALVKKSKEDKLNRATDLLDEHFNLEEVRVVFDVRDLAGYPRLRPYEILEMLKRGEIPPKFVENPYPDLQGIPWLKYIPQYCITEFCDLPRLVKQLKDYKIAETDLQLFNLICASDYGCKKCDIFNALIRYEAYSRSNEKYKKDPYGYILDELISTMRILHAYED